VESVVVSSVCAGDEAKLSTVRLLRGHIELLGAHVTTLVHSDVHLHRLSAALAHVLQFDCSLIQIIEERTAGKHPQEVNCRLVV